MELQETQRRGTTNYGKKYESHIPALVALRCYFDKDIENFWMLSNAEGYGNFDDIVLHITRENSSRMIVIQLKHKESAEITYNQLCKASGDFSIRKYEKDYEKIMKICYERYDVDDVKFVLYTPASYKHNSHQDLVNIQSDFELEESGLLNSSHNRLDPFKMEFSGSVYNENFLQNLYLFTEQAHANKVETLITNLITSKISKHIDSNLTTILLKYFEDWVDFKSVGYCKFDKKELEIKLLELITKSYVQYLDLEQDVSDDTAAHDMWNQVALVHDVIFLPYNRDFSTQVIAATKWKIQTSEAWSLFKESKLLQHDKYRTIILKRKKQLTEPESGDLYFALWELNEIPLILYCQNPQDYEIVVNTLRALNKHIKKFIIFSHEKEAEDLKGYKLFKNLKESNGILKGAKISLQGRQPIEHRQLYNNEAIASLITPDIFLQIAHKKLQIGNEVVTGDYLVDRFFRRIFVGLESPQEMSEMFVLLLAERDMQYLISILEKFMLLQKKAKTRFAVTSESLETLERVKLVSTNNQPGHFILRRPRLGDGTFLPYFEWCYSTKDTKIVPKYFMAAKSSNGLIDEKFLRVRANQSLGYYNTPVIICNNAGMGKTVALKYLSTICPPDIWVVFIEVPKHINRLLNMKTDENIWEILEYFLHPPQDKAEDKKFVSTLFKRKLEENQVMFFFDDYDEFCRGKIDHFLQLLISHTDRIWITTRPPNRRHLEKMLDTVAIELVGFDVNMQREYLKKLLDQNEIAYVLEKLDESLEAIKSSFGDEIMRIPLQVKMVGDILSKDGLDYFAQNKLSVSDLYEKFICLKIDRRTDIYLVRKIAVIACYKEQLPEKLINRGEVEAYKKDHRNSLRSYIFEGCDENGDPIFVHPSYAEYLTAVYLKDHLASIYMNYEPFKCLLRKNLNWGRFFPIRIFFDMILAKERPLHKAVLSDHFTQVEDLINHLDIQTLLQDTDECGRTVLHLAASYGTFFPLPSFSLSPGKEMIDLEGNLVVPDVVNMRSNGETIFSLLVEKALETAETRNLIFGRDNLELTVCDYAYSSGCLKNVEILKSFVPRVPLSITQPDHNVFLYHCLRNSLNNIALDLDFSCLCHLKCNNEYLVNTAVKYCSLEVIRKVLENLGECRTAEEEDKPSRSSIINQRNLLNSACEREEESTETVEIITLLVKEGASVIWSESQQPYPLHTAVYRGNLRVLKALLGMKTISINAVDDSGRTALHVASERGHTQCVMYLIENNADVDLLDTDGNSALQISILNNNVGCATELIKHGADVNQQNNIGNTPLILAAKCGSRDIFTLLLNNQADISRRNRANRTALMCTLDDIFIATEVYSVARRMMVLDHSVYPSKDNVVKCIRELLHKGEDIETADLYGNTTLMLAVRSGQFKFADILLQMGADCRKFNEYGSSVLTYAIEVQSEDYVKKFLQMGVPVDGQDGEKNTHLMLAVKWGSESMIKLLLQNNCSVNGKNRDGLTPLAMIVARNFSENYVSELLSRGAEPENVAISGNTDLMQAIKSAEEKYAITLLENATYLTSRNKDAVSALKLALEAGLEGLTLDIVYKINGGNTL